MQGELKSNQKAGQKRRRKVNYYFHFPSYRFPAKQKEICHTPLSNDLLIRSMAYGSLEIFFLLFLRGYL